MCMKYMVRLELKQGIFAKFKRSDWTNDYSGINDNKRLIILYHVLSRNGDGQMG